MQDVQERNSVVARMLIDVDRYELWENLRNAFEASQVPGTTTSMVHNNNTYAFWLLFSTSIDVQAHVVICRDSTWISGLMKFGEPSAPAQDTKRKHKS